MVVVQSIHVMSQIKHKSSEFTCSWVKIHVEGSNGNLSHMLEGFF